MISPELRMGRVGRGSIAYDDARREGGVYIHPDSLKEVAFLAADIQTAAGVERQAIGTCFFTHVRYRDGGAIGYVVTAKHVVKPISSDVFVRINDPKGGVRYVKITFPWHFPEDESVDIAIAAWGDPDDDYDGPLILTRSYSYARILNNLQDRLTAGLPWPPPIGADVVTYALLPHYPGIESNMPIARFGQLSLVTNEKIAGCYGESSYHLISLQTYPGHSGAPVHVAEGNNLWLLGVLTGGYPSDVGEMAYRRSKQPGLPDKVINLGISTVAPISRLTELIMSDSVKKERDALLAERKKQVAADFVATSAQESEEEPFTKADFESALKKVSRKLSDEEKSET